MQHRIEINQSLLDQILEGGTYRECILSALNVENRTRQDLRNFLLEKKSRTPNLSDKTFINSYDSEIRNCLSQGFINENENHLLSLTDLGIEKLKPSLIYQNNIHTQPTNIPNTISANNNETSNEGLAQTTNSDFQQLTTVTPQITLKKPKDPYEKHILIILYEKGRLGKETLVKEVLKQRIINVKTGQKACWKEIKNCCATKKLVNGEGGIYSLTKKGKDKAEKLVAFRQNMQPSSTPAKTLESIAPSDPAEPKTTPSNEAITHNSFDPNNRYLLMSKNTGRISIDSLLNKANDKTPTESSPLIACTKMSIDNILN